MLLVALLMGFVGSLHCVGMCSPLAMAATNWKSKAFTNRLLYNLGRIATYGILGALVGAFGWLLPLSQFQHFISICMGILLVLLAVLGIGNIRFPLFTPTMAKTSSFLKSKFSYVLQKKTSLSTLLLGTLNGILPCGLTFIALSYCITLGSPVAGLLFMITFGIGTLPAMLGAVEIFQFMVKRLHLSIKKITVAMLLISGCLLIARVFIEHEYHQRKGDGITICGRAL